jgi:patatin-like phospholipase/acyl hydrolase
MSDPSGMPDSGLRLLALDGAGVRGLTSLMILQQLMATVDPTTPPKPCEYFDMIGGTSTGGYVILSIASLRSDILIDASSQ